MFESSMNRRSFVKGCIVGASLLAGADAVRSLTMAGTALADEGQQGGTLSYYISNPTSIDPFDLEEFNGIAVAAQLFDTLTHYDYATQTLEPLACESWEANDDADEWTFKIRDGYTFHDGSKVTAASFKYGWERLCSPNTTTNPSVVSYHLGAVEGYDDMVAGTAEELTGVTCPDELTLKVKLSHPYADFAYVVSAPALSPIPDCAKDNFAEYSLAPVGNGPFKMKGKWEDGQYIELERYEDYAGDKPLLDGIQFKIFKDNTTAYLEFQGGNLDECDVPSAQVNEAIANYGESEDGYTAEPGKQVLTGSMLYTSYLGLNVTDPVLQDKRVRQALSCAINRQAICDVVYQGNATPAGDIVPEAMEGNDESRWTYSEYDPEKAKQLLEDAGYPAGDDGMRGIDLEILVSSSKSDLSEFQMYIADWQAVGINVTINQMEYATMLASYTDGTYQIGSRGWYADYPIMDNYLYSLMYTGVGDNVSHYSSEEFDTKLDEARSTVDNDERVKLMEEADAIAAEDVPIIPVVHKGLSKVGSARAHFTVDAAMTPLLKTAWVEA